MNLELIVDGYNLMWTTATLNPVARIDFNKAKDLLLKLLSAYQKRIPESLVLVLDGYKGASPYTRRIQEEGVEMVVTGKGITADRWIMDTLSREGFQGAVVTSDHEIKDFASSRRVAVITSGNFEKQMMDCLKSDKALMDEIHGKKREYQALHKRRQGRR